MAWFLKQEHRYCDVVSWHDVQTVAAATGCADSDFPPYTFCALAQGLIFFILRRNGSGAVCTIVRKR
jgi:hypothetical protein